MNTFGPYLVALTVFLVIDAIWLGVVARSFFVSEMGELLRDDPNLWVALLFYCFYVAGLIYFAVNPGLREQSRMLAVLNGAFLGFLAYGTYDITNLAVIKGYTWRLAVVDIAWGTVLSGLVSATTYFVSRKFAWGPLGS